MFSQRYCTISICCCCSITESRPTLQLHGLQHARLLSPPLSPGVCSDSCPLSQWCYLIISSSAAPFSFCLQSFQHQVLLQWISFLHQWPNCCTISFRICPSEEYSGLISFKIDLFTVQGVSRVFSSVHINGLMSSFTDIIRMGYVLPI